MIKPTKNSEKTGTENLLMHLREYTGYNLESADFAILLEGGKTKTYGIKENILQQGKTQTHFYIVLEGIQRAYFSLNDKEITMQFTFPNGFSCVPDSFLKQTPSNYFIESISPTKQIEIPYDTVFQIIDKNPSVERFFRKYLEETLIKFCQHQQLLLTTTIEERFKLFMSQYAGYINLIPNKHIASYLRIDPSNFSKLLGTVKL